MITPRVHQIPAEDKKVSNSGLQYILFLQRLTGHMLWWPCDPLTARYFSPLPGFESRPGHVRKLLVIWGWAADFDGYSGFLHYLHMTSHELVLAWHKWDEKRNSKFKVICSVWMYNHPCKTFKTICQAHQWPRNLRIRATFNWSFIHPFPGNWVAIGRVVMYFGPVANSFRAGIECGHQSRYLETGCPNRGFIDFCVSKVWYKIHTTNKIDHIPLHILFF